MKNNKNEMYEIFFKYLIINTCNKWGKRKEQFVWLNIQHAVTGAAKRVIFKWLCKKPTNYYFLFFKKFIYTAYFTVYKIEYCKKWIFGFCARQRVLQRCLFIFFFLCSNFRLRRMCIRMNPSCVTFRYSELVYLI